MPWMIYGAYGYTGKLVADVAARRGEKPVLAGRDENRLASLGDSLGLEHMAFDLRDAEAVTKALAGFDAVAHCAGPFSATARPMVEACLATRTHYLDITGEIDVFEEVLSRDEDAKREDVALLPGSGFDVVPSDCLAAMLWRAVPEATTLSLAVRMGGGASPGTTKTMVESLGSHGRCRVGGVIREVPPHLRRRRIEFVTGTEDTLAVSWGDVSTAYHSTGIENVTVYMALPRGSGALLGITTALGPVVRTGAAQSLFKSLAGRLAGPSGKTRGSTSGEVWGEVLAPDGTRSCGSITTPNGYELTADSVVRVAQRLVAGDVAPGASTPSKALGADFVRELDGVAVHRT